MTIEGPNSQKRMRVFQRISELEALPEGWDSYDGKPLDPLVAAKVIDLCLCLVPRETEFSIVPCADGSAQIEWHRDGLDVEIHVAAAVR